MDRERPGPGRDGGGSAAWGLLIAMPLMLLCCGGPLLAGPLGAGALAAFWARGYGYLGIALLVLAGAAVAAGRGNTRTGAAPLTWPSSAPVGPPSPPPSARATPAPTS